jgi:hypothetical protein
LSSRIIDRLDVEHLKRASDVYKHSIQNKEILLDDLIPNSDVRTALESSKLILPSFDVPRIYSNFPFSSRLFVQICPQCLVSDGNIESAIEIFSSSDAIPILLGDYKDYPPEFVSGIIGRSHLSKHEFLVFRSLRILSLSKSYICNHCVDEQRKSIIEKVSGSDRGEELQYMVNLTISKLRPFVDPDFELIETLEAVVDSKDFDGLFSLYRASFAINELRTCQALESRCSLNAGQVPSLIKDARKFLNSDVGGNDPAALEGLIEPFKIDVDPRLKAAEFFEIAAEFRDELSGIIDGLVDESESNGALSLSKLSSRIGELNSEMARLKGNKRYLGYRAIVGFFRANRALVGTAIVAGALGLSGNLVGCGAAVAVGGIGKAMRNRGKLKAPPEVRAFMQGVKQAVRPKIHKLLSAYTSISLPAVQLHEISRVRTERTKGKTAFRSKVA